MRLLAMSTACVAAVAITACGSSEDDRATTRTPAAYDRGLHDALPARIRSAGRLTIAGDASYAPAESFAPDGHTIVGFEPDLADALGSVLGVDVHFANSDFASLLDRVRAGEVDAVMSAMTDTPEREHGVDFVNYFSAGSSIVVQRGNADGITDLASLCGATVAVENGTTQVDLLARSQKRCRGRRIDVRQYETNADALLQLRTGRARAVLNDYPPAVALTTDPKTRSQYQLASTTQYEPGFYGIAIARDEPALRDALAAALDKLIRSGVYKQILERWDVTDGAVPTASVNAGAASSPQ